MKETVVDQSPIFILAPPRSFTSITCAMIGQHPQMYGLPEVNLFAAETYSDFQRLTRMFRPRLAHGLFRAVAELGLDNQQNEDIDAAQRWLDENRGRTSTDLFRQLMEWATPRRLVDKSPIYVTRAEFMERIDRGFPNALYIHLVRHPRGNLESIHKKGAEIPEREQRFAKALGGPLKGAGPRLFQTGNAHPENVWLKGHRRVCDFLERVPQERWMRIRGEDLLESPRENLEVIAGWLGISTEPEAIEAMLRPEDSPFAVQGPGNAPGGNDPGFLEDPRLRPYRRKPANLEDPVDWIPGMSFSAELKALARSFGYE